MAKRKDWIVARRAEMLKRKEGGESAGVLIHRMTGTLTRMGEGVDDRTYEVDISTGTRDRHRTVVVPGAFRLVNFNNNPIVAYMHKTSDDWWTGYIADPDDILGFGEAWVNGDVLKGKVTFETEDINPRAEKIKKKIDFGTLRAVSAGFIPINGHWGDPDNDEDSGTYYFTDVELVEFSIVNIPSNPDALISTKGGLGGETKGTKETKGDLVTKDTKEVNDALADSVRGHTLFLNQKFLENV